MAALASGAVKLNTVSFTVPAAAGGANVRCDMLFVYQNTGAQCAGAVEIVVDGNTSNVGLGYPVQLLSGSDFKYFPVRCSLPPGNHTFDLYLSASGSGVSVLTALIDGLQFFA